MSGYRVEVTALPAQAVIAVEAGPAGLAALAAACGVALPPGAGTAALSFGPSVLVRPGPESILLIGPDEAAVSLLDTARRAVADDGSALVEDLTGAHGWVGLEGPQVRAVLAQGVAIDLRDAAWPVGSVLRTLCFGVEVLLHRRAAERVQIGTRASLAPFLEARLRLAAQPASPPREVLEWR